MKNIYLVSKVNPKTKEIKLHFGAFTSLEKAQKCAEQLNNNKCNTIWIVEKVSLD